MTPPRRLSTHTVQQLMYFPFEAPVLARAVASPLSTWAPCSGPAPDNSRVARDGEFYPPREHPCGGYATATEGATSV
jgi:hypothetical protein